MTRPAITIGQTVWVLDTNRRVYTKAQSAPIYREYFTPHKVIGETSVSWLLEHALKIDKRTGLLRKPSPQGYFGLHPRIYISSAEVEDACYVNDHCYTIGRAVQGCKDAEILRQIKALLESKA